MLIINAQLLAAITLGTILLTLGSAALGVVARFYLAQNMPATSPYIPYVRSVITRSQRYLWMSRLSYAGGFVSMILWLAIVVSVVTVLYAH